MRTRTSILGNLLVAAGALVGVATIALVATGHEIVLTPGMIHLLIYKGLGAAAVGLMIAGSWIGRRGRAIERQNDRAELSEGAPALAEQPAPLSHDRERK